MSDGKKVINYDSLIADFRRTMEHEEIPEEKRENIVNAVGDHVGNCSEDYVLREDVRFRSDDE